MRYKIPFTDFTITENYILTTNNETREVTKNEITTLKVNNVKLKLTGWQILNIARLDYRVPTGHLKALELTKFEVIKHDYYKTFFNRGIAVYFKKPHYVNIDIKGTKVTGRLCPMNPRLLITDDVVFYRITYKQRLKICIPTNKDSYPMIGGFGKNARIHRLVASTYCVNPKTFTEAPIVNHINGNKHDYRHSNLEWVSSLDNSLHAVKTGLNKQAKAMLLLDTKKNKTYRIDSLKQLNSYLERSVYDISHLPKLHKHGKLENRYIVKLESDTREWKDVLYEGCRYVLNVKNPKDERIDVVYGLNDFKQYLGDYSIKDRDLERLLQYAHKINPKLRFEVVKHDKMLNENKMYQTRNAFTGEIVEHETLRGLAKKVGIHKTSFITTIKKGEDFLPTHGWVVREKSDKPWVKLTEFARGLDIYRYKKDNGTKVYETNSLRDLAKLLNVNRKNIDFYNKKIFINQYELEKINVIDRICKDW